MPRALLSVYDKTGLVEFAQTLHALGWILLASGNTAKLLREQHLPVTEVADYTQSPELLGGRVKTLHPAIHAGLLARNTQADHAQLLAQGWDFIDLVAVNLYPFEKIIAQPNVTLDEAIENIDIGGVALMRAAAKNHERVTLISDPQDYSLVLDELTKGNVTLATRKRLAVKGFITTSQYDTVIANYLSDKHSQQLTLFPIQKLRYGENPHQTATLFSYNTDLGPLGGKLLQGKELSYNNLLDLDAAWKTVLGFTKPTVCIVKHLSPCGIASAPTLAEAFTLALAADPLSAYGGIIASNIIFDEQTAMALDKLFVEAIVAPEFSDAARKILMKRQNCRLLAIADLNLNPSVEWRSVNNGLLCQDIDLGDPANIEWKVVTQRQPTEAEWHSLRFAWRACQYIKSNAIVIANGEATIGVGGGQPNRIDCVHIAAKRAANHTRGAVLASDAFFPFADSIEVAANYGISAVIQPGGSVRDKEVIAAADAKNIAMVFTNIRHFKH